MDWLGVLLTLVSIRLYGTHHVVAGAVVGVIGSGLWIVWALPATPSVAVVNVVILVMHGLNFYKERRGDYGRTERPSRGPRR